MDTLLNISASEDLFTIFLRDEQRKQAEIFQKNKFRWHIDR